MIRFTEKTPIISDVFQYTFSDVKTRFDNSERDILISKVKIVRRYTYKKNKEGKYSTPDERIEVVSWSAPQYKPYNKVGRNRGRVRQLTIKHHYPIILCIQKDLEGNYSYQGSRIIWRVGSYKKWAKPKQSLIRTVYRETHNKLKKKYTNKEGVVDMKAVKAEEAKIRKVGKYLDVGDYNSQAKQINGDAYFRDYNLQEKFDCLYGPNLCDDPKEDEGIIYPFFDKHILAVLMLMMRKGIIKY